MLDALRRAGGRAAGALRGAMGIAPPPRYDRSLYRTLAGIRRWRPSDTVFDVGANDGRTALRLMRHLRARPRIYAFEPVSTTYEALVERTAGRGDVRCFQLAMGSEAGRLPIHVGELSVMSSFDPHWAGAGRTEMVEVTTVDAFVAQHDVDRIHLLKVDAEGHDLEVLRGAEAMLSSGRVDVVQVECGVVPGRTPTLEEVRSHLVGLGFHLHAIATQARGHPVLPSGERARPRILTYCDAVFVGSHLAMD